MPLAYVLHFGAERMNVGRITDYADWMFHKNETALADAVAA